MSIVNLILYWDIFEKDGYVEYHVSYDRENVVNRSTWSHRFKSDNPMRAIILDEWYNYIEWSDNPMKRVMGDGSCVGVE